MNELYNFDKEKFEGFEKLKCFFVEAHFFKSTK